MNSKFKRILYGGDYNPNQWPKDIWKKDMEYFKDARINSATINVFSWAKIQPSEDVYDFSQLDEIVEMLSAENYDIVMATSTAAMPAWLVKKYPEVARVDYQGRKQKFGKRHNACPNSAIYQKYASALVEKEVNVISCKPCKADQKAKIVEYLANTPGPDGTTITVKA
ncbi:MAG: beta-galactosidase [Erysipelotrichaceae bacterium]|nr:beta-galactosidase [Erysipelotrichaceae bacterium]